MRQLLRLPFDGDLSNLGSGNYTITNNGAQFAPTQCGQGLFFDGNDDFVSISPSMNLVNDFTVCAWINPSSQGNGMGIFSIREQCTSTYRGYSILQFNLGDYNVATLNNQVNIHQNCTGFSAGDRYTNAGILIPNNQETFVALSVQNNISENRVVKLYVNCAEYSTTMTIDFPTAVCFNGSQNYTTTVGASSGVTNHTSTFHGTIDQLRVYDIVLNSEQILDVYQSCLPLTMDVVEFPNCNADSAQITLYNTELDVSYQLINANTNTPVGPIQPGNCGNLVFNTGIYSTTTQFEITATNNVSNCNITLDTTIILSPSVNSYSGSQNITLCSGDSVQYSGGYITSAGTYIDTIPISSTCDSIITLNVTEISPYSLDLGSDFTLCPGASQTLTVPSGASNYTWQNGSTVNSFLVDQAGIYWVNVIDQCGSYTDSVIVSTPQANINLGNDTTLCSGTTLTLDASSNSATYLWQDNSTNSTYTVNSSGVYWVEVSISSCIFTDSITISTLTPPTVDLGNDTSICDGETIVLSPSTQFVDTYLWSTNETSSSITANQTGIIWVEGTNQCGTSIDSIDLTVNDLPIFDLGNDTILCTGDGITLNTAIPNTTTTWQNGTQSPTLYVDQPGTYSATVNNQFCSYEDEITISYTSSPTIDLGPDTVICFGDQFFLSSTNANGVVNWNIGSQEPVIIVNEAGIYAASVTNACGQAYDEILIETTDCLCEVYLPNSFTPHDNGKFNNTFGPVHECDFTRYLFKIYDCWGEVVFESENPAEVWSGYYLNRKVQTGVYVYQLLYSIDDEEEVFVTGHVNVIH
ncbi:MAG: gliding motility-associated C-terminal domain-containing protein [Flavobacteriales bacterium]|nr:gliding motility-associated C-terminal domain-containing protein [Flavobacteriales bacterium]